MSSLILDYETNSIGFIVLIPSIHTAGMYNKNVSFLMNIAKVELL